MHYQEWDTQEFRALDLRAVDEIIDSVRLTMEKFHNTDEAENAKLHVEYMVLAMLTLMHRGMKDVSREGREANLVRLLDTIRGWARASLLDRGSI